jgi:multiple sugar transport system permease protein
MSRLSAIRDALAQSPNNPSLLLLFGHACVEELQLDDAEKMFDRVLDIDPDQIEAARLDGAKGWRMLWYVVLPQLRPATFIAVIVTVIGALRSFDLVSIMTNGGPFGSSRVLSYYMYEKALGEYGFRMGYGAAIAVVLFAIMMIFISGFIWKMWRDEAER